MIMIMMMMMKKDAQACLHLPNNERKQLNKPYTTLQCR